MANDSTRAARAIGVYFFMVGLKSEALAGFEQLLSYSRLLQLNTLQGTFAFQKQQNPDGKLPPYHYDGRYIAWWVHKLAWRYGWARDDILNLWPEEAAAYLQEILVQEIDDYEQRRSLSELSYSYNKDTNKSRFIPTPKPAWMVSSQKQKRFRIRRDMMPVGEIIELDKLYTKPD